MGNNILTYDSQLKFKKWAMKNGLTKKQDFYFDHVTAVDATKDEQPDIAGVKANGTLTWNDALLRLKKYFKVA